MLHLRTGPVSLMAHRVFARDAKRNYFNPGIPLITKMKEKNFFINNFIYIPIILELCLCLLKKTRKSNIKA